MTQATAKATQFDIGAVITAPTRDPEWIKKCLIMGLISMIPIAGALNLSGWMRAIAEKRLAGDDDGVLPEANLAYMSGGWKMFVAWLPLVGIMMAMMFGLSAVGVGAIVAGGKGAGEAIGMTIFMAMYMAILAFSFAVSLISPAISFLHIVEGESFSSVAFRRQFETIKNGGWQYIMLFLAVLVGGMIGQLGIFVFFIGIFVTVPFAQAITGFAIAEYARVCRPVDPAAFDGSAGGQSGQPFGVKI